MASAAEELLFEHASIQDQNTARYFGIAIGGLTAVFIIVHWTQRLANKHVARSSALARVSATVLRPLRRTAKGVVFGGILIMPGQIMLATVYFAINIILTFTNVDWALQTLFAKRLGWMALCNLCLVVFLGLKNTPLSPIAGQSYESLNVLHRCCGYTTILYMVLHSIIYVTGLAKAHALYVMSESGQYAGATAGLSMLLILITAVGYVRRRQYELFYIVHVVLVAVILATVGVHTYQPLDISPRTMIIVGLAAAIWVIDRFFRLSRWLYYGVGNYCTLTPLPEGATKVRMHRAIKATPGSHAFFWIPGVRIFQTHPFSLLANNPAEFVITARDGFTRDLYEIACATPGARFRAAFEGAYGHVPEARIFDKVVLIAGGSGATFTLALALDWARNIRLRKHRSTLEFVWTVKSKSYLQWFDAEIAELQACAAVTVRIHVTGSKLHRVDRSWPSQSPSMESSEQEKGVRQQTASASARSSDASELSKVLVHGRPDLDGVIERAVVSMPSTKRVLVAAAGPSGLLTDIRVSTSARMIAGLPSVHLHLEEFDW